jgi:hypothetical protein
VARPLYTFFVHSWKRAASWLTGREESILSNEEEGFLAPQTPLGMTKVVFFVGLTAWMVAATSGVSAQDAAAGGVKPPLHADQRQEPAEKEKSPSKPSNVQSKPFDAQGQPELPFQIQLLETHIRFEANGDAHKEVHTIVKINNILGAHQFARLAFDYNRSFQQVEIPVVHISHANGGTSDVLPSAVTDAPNPVVEAFPAFQDVRVKAVRVLGLQEGDTIEYRVTTTTTKHPLAPDFWLEHTFDRSGQVLHEIYELNLPGHVQSTTSGAASKNLVHVSVPWTEYRNTQEGQVERSILKWNLTEEAQLAEPEIKSGLVLPDILVNTFGSSFAVADRLSAQIPKFSDGDKNATESWLTIGGPLPISAMQKLRLSYELVSQRLTTVDLAPGAEGFRVRPAKEILASKYGTAEEKCYLFTQLAKSAGFSAEVVFYGEQVSEDTSQRPAFQKVFVYLQDKDGVEAFDPSIEVAPFGMIAAQYRGKRVMSLSRHDAGDYGFNWLTLPEALPFRSHQLVGISAEISAEGQLSAKVKYTMRGDNELLLRVAFSQAPKEKWKDVANLLAISDGFRGQIVSVNASDPRETKDPFTVEYELAQPKFVDWSKTPVRIPALLPQIGLPDTTPTTKSENLPAEIELGTPLEVQTTMTLKLPPGTTVETPPGTSVSRDYATFASKYASAQNTVTASRHINFLKRELPADRAMDYNAFVRAVQNDQAQRFTLVEKGK